MASVDELLDLVKCGIRFTTEEGIYEGELRVVCPVSRKLIIDKLYLLPKRIFMGTLFFQCREILSYDVIRRPNPDAVKLKSENHTSYSYTPTQPENICITDDFTDVEDFKDDDYFADEPEQVEEYELKLPTTLFERLPMDVAILDNIDNDFLLAIKHIKKQDRIGVSLEGPKIDRHGTLTWLCISTSFCTFLFDIEKLSGNAFEKGLKSILEAEKIEKVMHDCRQASDCLYHRFNIRLANVFDTQMADMLVNMQKNQDGKVSKRAGALNSCLRTYLNVPEEYLYRAKDYQSYESKIIHFRLRPLPRDLQDVMIKNVVYLGHLRDEMGRLMLTPFRRCVQIYLNVLQSATDRELLLAPSIPEEIPDEILMEGLQVVRLTEFADDPSIVSSGPPYRKLNNPIKGFTNYCKKYNIGKRTGNSNSSVAEGSSVTDQRDSISHQKSETSDKNMCMKIKDHTGVNTLGENMDCHLVPEVKDRVLNEHPLSILSRKLPETFNKIAVEKDHEVEFARDAVIRDEKPASAGEDSDISSDAETSRLVKILRRRRLERFGKEFDDPEDKDSSVGNERSISDSGISLDHSSSSSVDGDTDFWATLRTEFKCDDGDDESEREKLKFRFVPA